MSVTEAVPSIVILTSMMNLTKTAYVFIKSNNLQLYVSMNLK